MDTADLKYTPTHEWVAVLPDRVRVGITDYAQQHLSDIVHAELPEPDDHHYEGHEEAGAVESLKTSMDLHAPVAGRVIAINTALLSNPEIINEDPYGEGWLIDMTVDDPAEVEALMDADEYEANLPEEEEED